MEQDYLYTKKPDGLSGNNVITILGMVVSECVFSHSVYGEGFYSFDVEIPRLSDAVDVLPVTISERIIERDNFKVGDMVYITGQIRSYNNYVEDENRNKLILTIFARDCENVEMGDQRSPNEVFLNGYICKPPIYRTTPFGREIADLLLAVNRSYNKSDYIPCIMWGRNARFCEKLSVGDNIRVWGRMQSRGYQKKLPDGMVSDRVAFEVSAAKIEMAEQE